MDVDAPNTLKRCSSAPLINEATSTAATSPTTNTAPRNTSFFNMFSNSNSPRTRRFSASSSPLMSHSTSVGPRLTPRVNQLRAEECADVANTREVAHERGLHTAMQMGQSCEDLTLVSPGLSHSPTRTPRFSPLPAVSPSPTRKYTTRRSLSPVPLRASSFSPISRPSALMPNKRRCEDQDLPLYKRLCTDRLTPSTPGTPDSDSLECTFQPVQPMGESVIDMQSTPDENHKCTTPS